METRTDSTPRTAKGQAREPRLLVFLRPVDSNSAHTSRPKPHSSITPSSPLSPIFSCIASSSMAMQREDSRSVPPVHPQLTYTRDLAQAWHEALAAVLLGDRVPHASEPQQLPLFAATEPGPPAPQTCAKAVKTLQIALRPLFQAVSGWEDPETAEVSRLIAKAWAANRALSRWEPPAAPTPDPHTQSHSGTTPPGPWSCVLSTALPSNIPAEIRPSHDNTLPHPDIEVQHSVLQISTLLIPLLDQATFALAHPRPQPRPPAPSSSEPPPTATPTHPPHPPRPLHDQDPASPRAPISGALASPHSLPMTAHSADTEGTDQATVLLTAQQQRLGPARQIAEELQALTAQMVAQLESQDESVSMLYAHQTDTSDALGAGLDEVRSMLAGAKGQTNTIAIATWCLILFLVIWHFLNR